MKIDDAITKVEMVDDGEGSSTKNPLLRSKRSEERRVGKEC